MLLVDDGQAQVAKLDPFLDQRVGADGDVDIASGQGAQGGGALGALDAAGQQRHAHGALPHRQRLEQMC